MTEAEHEDVRRFHISLEELEKSAHVSPDEQVEEIPANGPARGPGDDDLSRQQRDALRAGG